MTQILDKSIEHLYATFSIYTFKSKIDSCPCCVFDSDKEKIHLKQLKDLQEDDLSKYTFKAMTTWGDVNDFKHYLPRIFELIAKTDFIVDTFVVLGKLEFGKWRVWPENEQNAITKFLFAWWEDALKNQPFFDKEIFIEIYKLTGDIKQLLNQWAINFNDYTFLNFIDLINNHYYDISEKKDDFKILSDVSIEEFKIWINRNSKNLEKGFFHFAEKDEAFAEKISIAQYIFERT